MVDMLHETRSAAPGDYPARVARVYPEFLPDFIQGKIFPVMRVDVRQDGIHEQTEGGMGRFGFARTLFPDSLPLVQNELYGFPHGGDQVLVPYRFQNKIDDTQFQRAHGVVEFLESGHHDHPAPERQDFQVFYQIKSVHARHLDIRDDYFRFQPENQFARFHPVLGLAPDLHAQRRPVDALDDRFADEPVVVDYHRSDGIVHAVTS